jgi:tetratricopeptide (TPR) repeat protein
VRGHFGVARHAAEAPLTGPGEFVGTLKYTPPEQFAGGADARGDVYSLGVTLYELLTFHPPFAAPTPQRLIQLITGGAVPPPRSINPDIPTDLETVVLKAVARDPAHRYQTAAALAEDLLRTYEQIAHTGGEFPKLRDRAAEANHRIGDIRQRLGRFADAAAAYQAAIDLYAGQPLDVPGDLVRIKLARACNELGRTLASLRRFDEADRKYEQAVRTLSDAPKELADRPECRYELARAYYTLGQRAKIVTLRGFGQSLQSSPDMGKTGPPGPRRDPLPDRPPPGGRRPPLDRPPPGPPPRPEGSATAQRAVTLLEGLVREYPEVSEYRHLLACSYRDLATDRAGRGPTSTANAEKALALLRQLVADFPNVPDYRLDLCETLGQPRPDAGDRQRVWLEEAITLSAALVKDYPNVPDYAAARGRYLNEGGVALFLAGDAAGAVERLREAVAVQGRLAADYPQTVAYGFWQSVAERCLGRVLSERGEWAEARALLAATVARLVALRKADPRLMAVGPQLGMAYQDLARALAGGGETALAADARRKAREFDADRARDPFAPRR